MEGVTGGRGEVSVAWFRESWQGAWPEPGTPCIHSAWCQPVAGIMHRSYAHQRPEPLTHIVL